MALVKVWDLLEFDDVFKKSYEPPERRPKLGDLRMVEGVLVLLFIGFQRLNHFLHIRLDPMAAKVLAVEVLPVTSTFWRYLVSLGGRQGESVISMMADLRQRVWDLVGLRRRTVHIDMDTTVGTVYGDIEGAKKGHNPKHRGKKGLRPVLCFLRETREYLCGTQRKGQTINRKEVASLIRRLPSLVPECVERIIVRADEEFIGWKSVEACVESGVSYVFASQRCKLPLSQCRWYRRKGLEYTECRYQAKGWKQEQRYVVMRKRKKDLQERLLEEENYTYRYFVTNLPFRPHNIVDRYDGRADVENQISQAQHEGIIAIPSKSLEANRAFFQIVMLAYNLWRWVKHFAGHHEQTQNPHRESRSKQWGAHPPEIVRETVHVTRLKILYLAAKLTSHSNRTHILFSIHDTRTAPMIGFLKYLDVRRRKPKPWNPEIRAGP